MLLLSAAGSAGTGWFIRAFGGKAGAPGLSAHALSSSSRLAQACSHGDWSVPRA